MELYSTTGCLSRHSALSQMCIVSCVLRVLMCGFDNLQRRRGAVYLKVRSVTGFHGAAPAMSSAHVTLRFARRRQVELAPCSGRPNMGCQIHRFYELKAHERHHKVVITSGKLDIFFKPWVSELGACQWKNVSDEIQSSPIFSLRYPFGKYVILQNRQLPRFFVLIVLGHT